MKTAQAAKSKGKDLQLWIIKKQPFKKGMFWRTQHPVKRWSTFSMLDSRELKIIYSANEKLNASMMVCFAEKGTSFHLKWRLKGSALDVILLKRKNTYNRLAQQTTTTTISWHIPTSHSHISVVWQGLFLFLKKQFHVAVYNLGPDWGLKLTTEQVCTSPWVQTHGTSKPTRNPCFPWHSPVRDMQCLERASSEQRESKTP